MENTKTYKLYKCECCKFNTKDKGKYTQHLETNKHKNNLNKDEIELLYCHCGKSYKSRVGLWKHKKVCIEEPPTQETKEELIKGDNVLLEKMIDVIAQQHQAPAPKKEKPKQFNLEHFLNDICKDAPIFKEWFKEMKENTPVYNAEYDKNTSMESYIKKIIMMLFPDDTKRPIHCLDRKRKIFMVKRETEWERITFVDEKPSDITMILNIVSHIMNTYIGSMMENDCENTKFYWLSNFMQSINIVNTSGVFLLMDLIYIDKDNYKV